MDILTDGDDYHYRRTPPVPAKSSMTDLILYEDGDVMSDESKATSPTYKPKENVIPEEKPAGPKEPEHAEENPIEDNADQDADERNAVTSEEETSSAYSSDDASLWDDDSSSSLGD